MISRINAMKAEIAITEAKLISSKAILNLKEVELKVLVNTHEGLITELKELSKMLAIIESQVKNDL